MARPPHARERVLDAFEQILISEGERFATLDATAKRAEVSKGGLLYHFASKDELASAMIARLVDLLAQDVEQMMAAPEGPIDYFLRTSVLGNDPLDRAFVAVSRLAQSDSLEARETLRQARERWAECIRPQVRDQAALNLVMLVSDGLYFNNVLDVEGAQIGVPQGANLEALIDLVLRSATLTATA